MVAKYRLPPARDAFSVLVDNRRRSGIMSKVANLDRRFRVEAMRKFFSIKRCTSADRRGRMRDRQIYSITLREFSRYFLTSRLEYASTRAYGNYGNLLPLNVQFLRWHGDPLSVARVIDGKTSGKTLLVNRYIRKIYTGGSFVARVKLRPCLFFNCYSVRNDTRVGRVKMLKGGGHFFFVLFQL